MNIRVTRLGDAATLSEIAVEAAGPYRDVDFTEAGWARFLSATTKDATESRLNCDRYVCFCADNDEKIVGFITIKDDKKIDQLFVRPYAQRTGVAKCLWRHAKLAFSSAEESTEFWVRSSSVAIPAYRRFGFVEEGGPVMENGMAYQLMKLVDEPES